MMNCCCYWVKTYPPLLKHWSQWVIWSRPASHILLGCPPCPAHTLTLIRALSAEASQDQAQVRTAAFDPWTLYFPRNFFQEDKIGTPLGQRTKMLRIISMKGKGSEARHMEIHFALIKSQWELCGAFLVTWIVLLFWVCTAPSTMGSCSMTRDP